MGYIVAYTLGRPVEMIAEDVDEIARGNILHEIRRTNGYELRRLENSIRILVKQHADDLTGIQSQKVSLYSEMKEKTRIEKRLRDANQKLSLLSTITRYAIRHDGEKLTEIAVSFTGTPGEKGQLTVTDNGDGIAPHKKEKIFGQGYGSNTGYGLFFWLERSSPSPASPFANPGPKGKGPVLRWMYRLPSGACTLRMNSGISYTYFLP